MSLMVITQQSASSSDLRSLLTPPFNRNFVFEKHKVVTSDRRPYLEVP